jgi:predicted transcriptional regulator
MSTAKQAAREIIERLADIDAGRTIPHERVKAELLGDDH